MSTVKPNHPLAEILACKLHGFECMPAKEQRVMVQQAIKAAVGYVKALEAECLGTCEPCRIKQKMGKI